MCTIEAGTVGQSVSAANNCLTLYGAAAAGPAHLCTAAAQATTNAALAPLLHPRTHFAAAAKATTDSVAAQQQP